MSLSDTFVNPQSHPKCIKNADGVTPANLNRCLTKDITTETTACILNNSFNISNQSSSDVWTPLAVCSYKASYQPFRVSTAFTIDVTEFKNPGNRSVKMDIVLVSSYSDDTITLSYKITKIGKIKIPFNTEYINMDRLLNSMKSLSIEIYSTGTTSLSLSLSNMKTIIDTHVVNPTKCINGVFTKGVITVKSFSGISDISYKLTSPDGETESNYKGNFYVIDSGTYVLSDGCCSTTILISCEKCRDSMCDNCHSIW